MVHSVSGRMRGVQVTPQDPLRTRAIPERLKGVFMTRRYTNPHLPLPLTSPWSCPQAPGTFNTTAFDLIATSSYLRPMIQVHLGWHRGWFWAYIYIASTSLHDSSVLVRVSYRRLSRADGWTITWPVQQSCEGSRMLPCQHTDVSEECWCLEFRLAIWCGHYNYNI